MSYVIAFVGIALAINGFLVEGRAETSIQQIYGSIYVLGGLVIAAIGYVAHAVNGVKGNVKSMRDVALTPPLSTGKLAPLPMLPHEVESYSKGTIFCRNCGRATDSGDMVCECGMGVGR